MLLDKSYVLLVVVMQESKVILWVHEVIFSVQIQNIFQELSWGKELWIFLFFFFFFPSAFPNLSLIFKMKCVSLTLQGEGAKSDNLL